MSSHLTTAAHTLPPIVLIDDGDLGGAALAPLTDLRPAFDIRTGAFTLRQRVQHMLGAPPAALFVPESRAAITREAAPGIPVNSIDPLRGSVLAINARTAPIDHHAIAALVRAASGVLLDVHDQPVAAMLPASSITPSALLDAPRTHVVARADVRQVLTRPWHVRAMRDACLLSDLHALALAAHQRAVPAPAGCIIIPHPHHTLTILPGAKVLPGATFDLELGPIVIDASAVVRPGAMIIGPAYIGPASTVLERATIRPGTSVGPSCKVNGEIGGTIFQGFANKAHDGYLGDSYVGEWVNLGAGTTNSNLLNTYSDVIAKTLPSTRNPSPSNERTGEQFLGCVLGDHVKTAISTRIMTGSIIGTGTMFAASAPLSGTIAPLSWITDGDQLKPSIKPFRFEKFLDIAQAAMARRKVTPSPAYVQRLREISADA